MFEDYSNKHKQYNIQTETVETAILREKPTFFLPRQIVQ